MTYSPTCGAEVKHRIFRLSVRGIRLNFAVAGQAEEPTGANPPIRGMGVSGTVLLFSVIHDCLPEPSQMPDANPIYSPP
jgi:hypothetical protein